MSSNNDTICTLQYAFRNFKNINFLLQTSHTWQLWNSFDGSVIQSARRRNCTHILLVEQDLSECETFDNQRRTVLAVRCTVATHLAELLD